MGKKNRERRAAIQAAQTDAVADDKDEAGDDTVQYSFGPKPYKAKAEHNVRTWGKITKALSSGPKTLSQLAEVCKYKVDQGEGKDPVDFSHTDFIGYMIRGGHLAPVAAEAAA